MCHRLLEGGDFYRLIPDRSRSGIFFIFNCPHCPWHFGDMGLEELTARGRAECLDSGFIRRTACQGTGSELRVKRGKGSWTGRVPERATSRRAAAPVVL